MGYFETKFRLKQSYETPREEQKIYLHCSNYRKLQTGESHLMLSFWGF